MNGVKDFFRRIPIPAAALALALAGLGNLLQPYTEVLHIICGCLSLFLVCLLAGKLLTVPHDFRNDLENSITASVCATCFMSIIFLSVYVEPINHAVAFGIWIVATICQIAGMIWFTKKFIFHFHLVQVFPTYFIAYVGIIASSLTSPVYGMEWLGAVFFWFGFLCYLALVVVVSMRYIKYSIPEAAEPLICVYTAPLGLALAGYLAACDNPSSIFVFFLAVVSQFFLMMVLLVIPRLMNLNFYPSYAAMTFPFVITATGLRDTLAYFSSLGFAVPLWLNAVAMIEIIFATFMVLYVLAYYLHYIFIKPRRKECKKEGVNSKADSQ